MSLQKALVHLNMRGGIDSKDDERLVIPSKLVDLTNAVFDDATTIVRRGGTTSQALTSIGSTFAAGTPRRLITNKGNLLIEESQSSYGPNLRRVVKDVGQQLVYPIEVISGDSGVSWNFERAGMTTRGVSGNIPKWPVVSGSTNRAGQYDCATDGSEYSLWAWEERDVNGTGRMGIRAVLVHEPTSAIVHSLFLWDSGGSSYVYSCPRVVYSADSGLFYLYFARYVSGSTSFVVQVVTEAPTGAFSSPTTVYTATGTGGTTGDSGYEPLFDAVVDSDGTSIQLVVRDSTGTMRNIYFLRLSAADGFTLVNVPAACTAAAAFTALTVLSESDRYATALFNNANTVRAFRYDFSADTVSAETTVATGAGGTSVGRITGYSYNGSTWAIFYDNSTTAAYASPPTGQTQLRGALRNKDLTSASLNFRCFSGWLIGGRAVETNNRAYLAMFNPSDTQPTTYVVDVMTYAQGQYTAEYPPCVLARIDYGECGYSRHDWKQAARLATPSVVSSNLVVPYMKWVPDAQLVSGVYVQPQQLNRADINFTDQLGQAEVNGLTYLAGACPWVYDGRVAVEEGFHHAPEIYSLTAVAAGTGDLFAGLASGTYYVCCTLAWQDNRGNWHESAPSNVVSVAVTNPGTPDVDAVFSIPPTLKQSYQVLWYRTIASASTGPFYRAFDVTGTTITSDATLAACEQLYTTPGMEGQPLYHDPMPSCRHIENHQDRLFLSGCGDGFELAYSNQTSEGRGVEFSTLLFKRTDYEFGRVVSTQSQDGKLFVLGERKLGVLLGQGPTDTGEQDGYSDIEVIVHDTGAKWTAPRGVATTNEGVWFQSNAGIRLLGRNGALARDASGKYKGSEVDSFISSYISNAVVGASKQQIRFYHSNAGVLVYDTTWDQWSRFTAHTNLDAAYAEGRFYHITSTQLIYYDETAQTDAGGGSISMTGETAWLQFAGIQGFQRVYRAMFVGETIDNVTETQRFSLGVYYDYLPTSTTLLAEQDVATTTGIIQVEHHLATQKCEAIKFAFQFKSKTGVSRFRLTDITLQVGVKQGRFKLPAARRL